MNNTVHTVKANGFSVELEKGGTLGSFNVIGWIAYYVGNDGVRRAFQTYGQLAYAKDAAPIAAAKIHAIYAQKPIPAQAVQAPPANEDLFDILFGK